MRLVTESVEPEVALRRTWKKFGLAAQDGLGPNSNNSRPTEEIFMNLSMDMDFDKQEATPAKSQALETKSKGMTCKYCNGPHLTFKCPYKDTFAGEVKAKAAASATAGNVEDESSPLPSKYVPKFKRNMDENSPVTSSFMESSTDDRDNGLAIRITNLSDATVESDIRDLVSAIGVSVARCNVGRDRITGRCKGYAFVNFYSKEDAESVRARLNGYPYGNLILKVEIARPIENK